MNGEHEAVQKLVHLVEAVKKTIKEMQEKGALVQWTDQLEDALFTIDEHEPM